MATTTTRRCEHCGQALPPQSGRGRPRQFHPKCKRASDLIGWLVQTVEEIDYTPKAMAAVRSDLFALANDVRQRVDHAARRAAGQRLRSAREAAELSRGDLAAQSGVPVQRLSDFELGRRGPNDEERAAILSTFPNLNI